MAKKGTWEKVLDTIKTALESYTPEEDKFLTDLPEEIEEDEEDEDPNQDSFITRMTLAYNNLVEACETMPTSYSKEFKYKKDKDRARILYNRCVDIAEQYHNFLIRMKEKVI